MVRRLELRAWEYALIAFAAALIAAGFWAYLTAFPLKDYLFNLQDEAETREPMGVVATKKGILRRQVMGESEFKTIGENAPVYNMDTLVTGTQSTATLRLNDGSQIDLAPNTMARMTFQKRLRIGGVSRNANIDVVEGDVTGQANAERIVIRTKEKEVQLAAKAQPSPVAVVRPSPSPSPSPDPEAIQLVQLLSPRKGERLSVEKYSTDPKRAVRFEWKVTPPDRKSIFVMRRVSGPVPAEGDEDSALSEQYREVVIPGSGGIARFDWVARSPGEFEWEIKAPRDKPIPGAPEATRSSFAVEAEYEGIRLGEPLVAGQRVDTNIIRDRKLDVFELILRWAPFGDVEQYDVQVMNERDPSKPAIAKRVEGTSFRVFRDQVIDGRIAFKVAARLPNGFVAASPQRAFSFRFLPPSLVTPNDGTVVTFNELASQGYSVLFTWENTNFTDGYELEVAGDPQFTRNPFRVRTQENFYLLKGLTLGRQWWRVRSLAKTVTSPPSRANAITVVP